MSTCVEHLNELMALTENLNCNEPFLSLEEDNDMSKILQKKCLVGKLITARPFSATTIKTVLTKSWSLKNDFSVVSKRNNIFLFSFEDEGDVQYVLQFRPWSIRNILLVINEWPHQIAFDEIKFHDSPFWV